MAGSRVFFITGTMICFLSVIWNGFRCKQQAYKLLRRETGDVGVCLVFLVRRNDYVAAGTDGAGKLGGIFEVFDRTFAGLADVFPSDSECFDET